MEASELFDICERVARGEATAYAWRQMREVLVLACGEGTRRVGGAFGNLFSQVDFLCQRHGLRGADKVAVQTMRRHANQAQPPAADELPYDLRALVLFVSAVFGQAVPGSLRQLLPANGRPTPAGQHVDMVCVRCIVSRWDDLFIEAETEQGTVLADYGSTDHGRNLLYLRKILRKGMQLNLLDCTSSLSVEHPSLSDDTNGGTNIAQHSARPKDACRARTLTPRLIVVEPDFLVDISAVAACFTNYGHHPLLYTVNRLRPRGNSQSMLLGNFADTVLDHIVSLPPGQEHAADATLSTTLRRSFREQALRFLACHDFKPDQFKRDARQLVSHIAEAVDLLRRQHPEAIGRMLLEPSFVCERLGLQGRVDLMTSDLGLLIEQKSGKNMKIAYQSHDQHGLQLENHYVQLLLYHGVLHYNFGRSTDSTDSRLLYSRYDASQGLLAVNYYRGLFREAIMLRNQIVATELLAARQGAGRIVPLLTPEYIYKDVKPDGYFAQYVGPPLRELAAQVAALSPTERAYYERMLTFVYREQACQKLGCASQQLYHSSGAACDLWNMSPSEKQESGNIFAQLRIVKREKSDPQGGFDLITLAPYPAGDTGQPTPLGTSNFRRGDMVYLYAYEGQPSVLKAILYKGSIEELQTCQLTIRLNDGQHNPSLLAVGGSQTWAVEHGSSDLSTGSCLRGMQQFAAAHPRRRALLLGQRPPEADTAISLSRSYSAAYDDILLRISQARDYFLLVGPPGTGKTSQALRFMVAEELGCKRQDEPALLLMSYTNRAVDEICAMLDDLKQPYLRLGNIASCEPRFRKHLLEEALHETATLSDIRQYVEQVPIIVGTTSTLASRQDIFALRHFSLCIVDEASQILEPNIIGLLSSEQIERFVLVGDYKQLPAVVMQNEEEARVSEPCLQAIGLSDCRQSLFERLMRWERHCHRTQFIGTLDHQGRMHPDVARFPCNHFYAQEQLVPVPLQHQQEQALPYEGPSTDALDDLLRSRRVLFLDCRADGQQQAGDKVSVAEARLVALLLKRLLRFYGKRFDAAKTVGVIVPYRNQITMIRQEIDRLQLPQLQAISIDTVERYQGSQRDVIIYSFTVSHRFQLDFLTANTFVEHTLPIDRKLNVAMTRARLQLIMTGNAQVLGHNPLFREIIESYSPNEHEREKIQRFFW